MFRGLEILGTSAPLRTITGVAGPRCPRVASTCPFPIQVIFRGSALPLVTTRSPTVSDSTPTSPAGVRICVPLQKQTVVMSVPNAPVV